MTAISLTHSLPRSRHKRLRWQTALALLIVLFSLTAAFFPAWIASHNPLKFNYHAILEAPNARHLFGTDNFGRDMFARVIYAYRVDLQISLFTTLFPMLFGTLVGLLVGFYGGIAEMLF